jgi:hypothetical protein
MYFKENDQIGTSIINTYYTININLNRLITIKKFMDTIIETSKKDLEKIKFGKDLYRFTENNLILKFEDDIPTTLKDNKQ